MNTRLKKTTSHLHFNSHFKLMTVLLLFSNVSLLLLNDTMGAFSSVGNLDTNKPPSTTINLKLKHRRDQSDCILYFHFHLYIFRGYFIFVAFLQLEFCTMCLSSGRGLHTWRHLSWWSSRRHLHTRRESWR